MGRWWGGHELEGTNNSRHINVEGPHSFKVNLRWSKRLYKGHTGWGPCRPQWESITPPSLQQTCGGRPCSHINLLGMDRGNKRDGERLSQRERVRKKKMYRQIVKQLAFQLLTAFHVNVLDWHFLHIPAPALSLSLSPPKHTHTHTHTHTLTHARTHPLSPSLLLQYTLCQQKNKREGKAREGAGRRREWEGSAGGGRRRRGGKKKNRRNRRNQTLAGVGERSVLTGSEVKLPS